MAKFEATNIELDNGKSVILRHCALEDIELLSGFMDSIGRETTHTYQYPGRELNMELAKNFWEAEEKHPRALLLGAFSEGKLVSQVNFRPVRATSHPWVDHLAQFGMMTIKEYWGTGLSKILMEEAEKFARKAKFSRIEALVRTANKRGVRFYEKLGYQIEGTRRNAVFINGEFQDEFYIAKIL